MLIFCTASSYSWLRFVLKLRIFAVFSSNTKSRVNIYIYTAWMLIWSSIFSAATSSDLCFRVSIQNLCIFLVFSLKFQVLPKSSISSSSFLSFFSAKALLLQCYTSLVSCPYLSPTREDINEIWRTPSMWINILENRMMRQILVYKIKYLRDKNTTHGVLHWNI